MGRSGTGAVLASTFPAALAMRTAVVAALRTVFLISVGYAVIMLGELEKTFSGDAVSGRERIAGKCKVFFLNLLRRAAYLYVRAVAFKAVVFL